MSENAIMETLLAKKFNLQRKIKVTDHKVFIHISELCHLAGSGYLAWDSLCTTYLLFGRKLDIYIEEDELIWKML